MLFLKDVCTSFLVSGLSDLAAELPGPPEGLEGFGAGCLSQLCAGVQGAGITSGCAPLRQGLLDNPEVCALLLWGFSWVPGQFGVGAVPKRP